MLRYSSALHGRRLTYPVKPHAAGEYTLENASPEGSSFRRSPTLKSHRRASPTMARRKRSIAPKASPRWMTSAKLYIPMPYTVLTSIRAQDKGATVAVRCPSSPCSGANPKAWSDV